MGTSGTHRQRAAATGGAVVILCTCVTTCCPAVASAPQQTRHSTRPIVSESPIASLLEGNPETTDDDIWILDEKTDRSLDCAQYAFNLAGIEGKDGFLKLRVRASWDCRHTNQLAQIKRDPEVVLRTAMAGDVIVFSHVFEDTNHVEMARAVHTGYVELKPEKFMTPGGTAKWLRQKLGGGEVVGSGIAGTLRVYELLNSVDLVAPITRIEIRCKDKTATFSQ